jgi:hypothetical protein
VQEASDLIQTIAK